MQVFYDMILCYDDQYFLIDYISCTACYDFISWKVSLKFKCYNITQIHVVLSEGQVIFLRSEKPLSHIAQV
jgi:hypothetical protein